MDTFIGIDFGTRNIGLCIADTPLVEPLGTIVYKDINKALEQILFYLNKHEVKKIVVGLSEGDMAEQTKDFVKRLQKLWKGKIYFEDETLSSWEANMKIRTGGQPKHKRIKHQHEAAACLILQNFLDANPKHLIEY